MERSILNECNGLLGLSVDEFNELVREVKVENELLEKIRSSIDNCKKDLEKAIEQKNTKISEQILGEIKAYEEVIKMIRNLN